MMETNNTGLLIKMVRTAWDAQNNELTKLINTLTEEQLAREIAPGRNTGVYLLGHLIAVSDALLPLLGWGELLYPEMEELFIKTPDKSGQTFPTVGELKLRLEAVNAKLNAQLDAATAEELLDRHMAVKPEDFATQPHRNKLNVIISRTVHMANHIGQMLLLK
ncbi:MAG: DinB family protein [Chitinophagaceae bacterium]|nr:DinB family protein [Chitinophagaceae bacterium]